MNKPLTEKIVSEMGGALQRIEELSTKAIIETSDAAERRGLEQFLTRALLEHAPELLGSWVTVRQEYAPLVRGFASLIKNADSILVRPQTSVRVPKPECCASETGTPSCCQPETPCDTGAPASL